MGCFLCQMSSQQEQRVPSGLLRGLLVTVSFTSPRARLCVSLLARGHLGPHSWCRGAWQNLPELQVTLAKQACRWHCPLNLSVHGEWAFRPSTPTKESCLALGDPG